jgi:glycosyltransferase involved in cell wall biosynthesis
MRILMLSPFVPDLAASHGGGTYLAHLAQALSRRAELALVAFRRPNDPDVAAGGPWQWSRTLPLPTRPTGPGLPAHLLRMVWRWRRLPLVAAKHWHPGLPTLLERARAEFRPDVVCVELAQMAQYLPFLRGVPTILTDHEGGRPGNVATGLGAWGRRRDLRLWTSYTRRFYPLASLLQAVTEEDAGSLGQLLGREVAVRPPAFAVPAAPVAPDRAPARALFLGNYRHGPNPEAAAMLATQVLPLLRRSDPAAELWLAGPHPQYVQALAGIPGVRVLGFVPDLHGLFAQVRVLLAPLLSGSGFRVKALAALAHGLPVVTNRLGARGIDVPAPARTIAEGPEALANATLRLLRSPSDAAVAGRAAFAWARDHLAPDAVAAIQFERASGLAGTIAAV